MPEAKLTANVRTINTQVNVIDIQGDVNTQTENALVDSFARASSGDVQVVALNFAKLEYMNSSGIGLLVMLLIRAQRQQQRLVAFGLNDHYRQIFELTRLNEAITLYANEAEATAAVGTLKPQR
ncbi:MAG TPA: STAS domain-containing protein [Aggregatilineales bacterium]|nr:STAS domain-containing protein [Aggregatilineales bacterium]